MIVRKNKPDNGATLIVTQEELVLLWHKLNAAEGRTFKEYMKAYKLPSNKDIRGRMSYQLWEAVDEKFRPQLLDN